MNLTAHPLYKELRASGACCEDALLDTAAAVIGELALALGIITGVAEADCLGDDSNVWRSAIISANAALTMYDNMRS